MTASRRGLAFPPAEHFESKQLLDVYDWGPVGECEKNTYPVGAWRMSRLTPDKTALASLILLELHFKFCIELCIQKSDRVLKGLSSQAIAHHNKQD